MKRDFITALMVYAVLLGISFYFSIAMGLGQAESHHDPASLWLYARRCLMVVFALGIPWWTNRENLAACGWKTSPQWLIIAGAVGIGMGFSNKGGFNPAKPIALLLALFHTFGTELFFRRYLFKTLATAFTSFWMPLVMSAFLYGFFYLTVWTTWVQPLGGKIIFVILFSFLGSVFAYGYKKSGSFLVPWMMHFFAVLSYRQLF